MNNIIDKKINLPAQQDGILVLNKASGPSSTACISSIKRLGQKKIGHAGTLDPLAQGVLLVLLGQATKLSGHLMADGQKVYSGVLRLGQSTDTWDVLGKVVSESSYSHVTESDIAAVVASWLGKSEQEVPAYSAAKHQGQPLYRLARQGKETPVKTKFIDISQAEVQWVDFPRVSFRVTCSSGTYIRSLAHSLGTRLGTDSVLEELTREYSHPFGLSQAHDPVMFTENPELLTSCVLPLSAGLPTWAKLLLSDAEESLVKHGHSLPYQAEKMASAPFVEGTKALLMNKDKIPLALAERKIHQGQELWSILRGLWN